MMITGEQDYCHRVPRRPRQEDKLVRTKEFNHHNLLLILITADSTSSSSQSSVVRVTLTDWSWSVSDKCQVKLQHLSSEILSEKHFLVTNSEQLKIDKNFFTASGRLVNCVWRYIWEHLSLRFRSFNFMNPTIWLIKYFFVIYGPAQPVLTALFVLIKSLILSPHYPGRLGPPGDN